MAASCDTLRHKVQISFNCHCFFLFLLTKFKKSSAILVKEALGKVKESIETEFLNFIPEDPTQLCEMVVELNKRSKVLVLKNPRAFENSWIILDQEAILSEVTGTIFAPNPDDFKQYKDLTSSTGIVPFSNIATHFPNFDASMITKFLCHFEFCHEVTSLEDMQLLQSATSSVSQEAVSSIPSAEERFFFFPGLMKLNAPSITWEERNHKFGYQCGWIMHITQPNQFLTPNFLHVLLLRLAFAFALSIEDHMHSRLVDHPALQRKCSVWKNGIFWANRYGVECLVEVEVKKCISIMLRSVKGSEMECIRLRSLVIQKILVALKQFCPKVSTSEVIILPSEMQYPIDTSSSPTQFSIGEVARAVLQATPIAEPCVVNEESEHETLKALLYFDPYANLGQSIISELFDDQNTNYRHPISGDFLNRFTARVHQNKDFFIKLLQQSSTDWNLELREVLTQWREGSQDHNGSYECLRRDLDQFSIFAGRNPQVYCLYNCSAW